MRIPAHRLVPLAAVLCAASVSALTACGSSGPATVATSAPAPAPQRDGHGGSRRASRAPPHHRHRRPPAAPLGRPTTFSGCRARGPLPDPACTPGSVFAGVTAAQICVPGYARRARDVSEATRLAVLAAYEVSPGEGRRYELDHLIPLEVGGDNTQSNLWPELAPGYGAKDAVENELHDAVCAGQIALRTAQRRIARDWRRAGVPVPAAGSGTAAPAPAPSAATTTGAGDFCATHPCIASFAEGRGTIVQCADGEWSHSGGLPGACSRHGGVRP